MAFLAVSACARKDTLKGIMKAPGVFLKRTAQARWRGVSATDPLERRLARLQQTSFAAQQHIIMRSVTAKVRAARSNGNARWSRQLFAEWDPKRDFSFALLHAERLTRILCDEAVAEVLFAQARRDPERRVLLERYLERAEPRTRFLHDEITSTGYAVLAELGVGADEARLGAGSISA